MRETWGSNTLTPLYDNEDSVCGILHNSTPYYFMKNLQGDVVAITNKYGTVVARYIYDAWGKVLKVTNASGTVQTSSTFIGNVNPFRYRGYYYDTEIGLYYLQSRYYDSAVARFINADEASLVGVGGDILSYNSFTYCGNNSVLNFDPTGMFVWSLCGFLVELVPGVGGGVQLNWIYDSHGRHGIMVSVFFGAGLSIGISYNVFFSWRRCIKDMRGISYSMNGGFSYSFLSIGIGLFGDKKGISGISLSFGVSVYKYGGYGAFVVAEVIPIKKIWQAYKKSN